MHYKIMFRWQTDSKDFGLHERHVFKSFLTHNFEDFLTAIYSKRSVFFLVTSGKKIIF